MKKIITLAVSVLFVLQLHAQTLYPSGVSGCIGRWDFSSNGSINSLQDVSGNNNHGSANNISATSSWRNEPNKAGLFNGLSSFSEVNNTSNLNISEFTVAALININDFYSGPCNASQVLSKGYPYFVTGNYGLCIQDNYFDSDCNTYSPNNMQLSIQAGNQSNNPTAGNYLSKNKWYFVAVTFSSTNMEYYLTEMDSSTKLSSISPIQTIQSNSPIGFNSQNLSIGYHMNPTYPYWFNGKMDEVVLFNKALNNEEIFSIYDYLYGAPNSLTNVEFENDFSISNINREIKIKSKTNNYSLKILSLEGKTIYSKLNCNSTESINLSEYPTQMFILEIQNEKNKLTRKI